MYNLNLFLIGAGRTFFVTNRENFTDETKGNN